MKNPETSSAGAPADEQETNPADILTEVPGANTASAEILTEQPPVIVPLGNETATDRTPDDKISPQADASVNVFEKNPDDSTDITAEFDDAKAQEIEQQLEEQEPTGQAEALEPESQVEPSEPEKPETLEPILDVAEGAEQEITPSKEDYESFSSYYFASLCDQLDNPNANQTRIYESIAVLPSLINLLNEVDPSDPTKVFQHIAQTYTDLATEAHENGQEDAAQKQELYAEAANEMATHFNEYLRKRSHLPAEKESGKGESPATPPESSATSETPPETTPEDAPAVPSATTDSDNPLTSGPMIE